MGMFDSVHVRCPRCQSEVEFQSKAGACDLRDFTLETAIQDLEVLADVSRKEKICGGCGSTVGIQVVAMAQAVIR